MNGRCASTESFSSFHSAECGPPPPQWSARATLPRAYPQYPPRRPPNGICGRVPPPPRPPLAHCSLVFSGGSPPFRSDPCWLNHLRMVCCCLCCPIYKCAFSLCIVEIFASVVVWYNLLDFIVKTFEVLQLKDVLLFIILSGWLVTLFTSTGTLILAERKKNAEYLLPRLIQQAGLLVIGFLVVGLLVVYFSGGSASINNIVISFLEFIVLDQPMTKDQRREAADSIKYAFMILIVLDFFFICYMAFGLAITRKYQKQLERNHPITVTPEGRHYQAEEFKPLNQSHPSAPPPPYNPQYKV